MIWADKLTLFVTMLIAGFLVFMWATPPAPALVAEHSFAPFFPIMGTLLLKIILPFWLGLRTLDWMFDGPQRRKGQFRINIL